MDKTPNLLSADNRLNNSARVLSPKKNKIGIFSLGAMGLMAFSYFLFSFLIIYGVSMLGLTAFFIGTIYSISQILYSLLLPFFGNLSDHLRDSKIGSRIPLIIIGIPGLIGIFYLFWVIPPSPQFGTLNNRTTILYTVLLLMYRFFFACIWASYQGMIPDIAQNEKQQIQINANINIFSYIGQIIGTFLPVIILTSFPFIESAESDYFWLLNSNGIGFQIRQNIQSFLFVLFIILVISFVLALSFNSIAKLDSSCLNTKIKIKHSFRSTYILFLKDKKLVYTYLTNLVFVIIIGSLNFISINFAVYSLKLGPLLNLYYVLIVIASFSSFFLSSLLAQKWGIKKMLLGGSVVISCCLLSMSVFFIFNSLFFIQIGACILISMISFMAGTTGIYFSSIIIKLSSQTEKTLNRTISGNSLSIFHAFGNLGNIFAVLMVSAVLDWLGSTLFTTYVWIFVGCGVLNLATIFFVRKIHI